LRREGRSYFSGFYQRRPFTVQYHQFERGEQLLEYDFTDWHVVRRTIVTAELTDSTGLLRYHMPSFVGLKNVYDVLLDEPIDAEELVTWTKYFWFMYPGDKIRFLADVIATPDGHRLAIPFFTSEWFAEFIHRLPAPPPPLR
jgi:hypothetical protein